METQVEIKSRNLKSKSKLELYLKLIARYIVIGFIMYLAYRVTSVEWLNTVRIDTTNLNIIIGAIFGGLTLVLQGHFITKIKD